MSFAEVVTHEHPLSGSSVSDRGNSQQRSRDSGSVLYFGAFDASPASVRTAVNGITVVEPASCMWVQLTQQFDLVVIDGRTIAMTTPETCRAVVHAAVQHVSPGGRLVASLTIHDLVFDARSRITRIEPGGLRTALHSRNPPTVIDTRWPQQTSLFSDSGRSPT